MDKKNKTLYSFERVTLDNFEKVEGLFDEKFFFQTTYPSIVPIQVLETFLIKLVESYLLSYEDNIVGLFYCRAISDFQIQFKFMTAKGISFEVKKKFFELLVELMKDKYKFLRRLETTVFEFSDEEIQFYNELRLRETVIRKNEVLFNQKLYRTINYELDYQ